MSDTTRSEQADDLTDLPIQPTGSGTTDLEIGKLQAAVADGVADTEIETGIVDESDADRAVEPASAAVQARA